MHRNCHVYSLSRVVLVYRALLLDQITLHSSDYQNKQTS